MTEAPTVKCPQCGKAVKWVPQNAWRPFCSARCKALDLGAWAAESYRVPGSEGPDAAPRDAERARD